MSDDPIKNSADTSESGVPFYMGAAVQVILAVALYFIFSGSHREEIRRNWAKYRCLPHIMPFAQYYGFDAAENFSHCTREMVLKFSPEVMGPLYSIGGSINGAISGMVGSMMAFRLMFARLFKGVQELARTFTLRMQFVMQQLKMSFTRLKFLFQRLYGTFFAIMWMGTSAMAAGSTMARSSLFSFIDAFCFAPGTLVRMADGRAVAIETLQIGDHLESVDGQNVSVTSRFIFSGSATAMVQLGSISLSANHMVRWKGEWTNAGSISASTIIPAVPYLYCLNTSSHTLRIVQDTANPALDLVVADYDESENPNTVKKAQKQAAFMLNGFLAGESDLVSSYELGLAAGTIVAILTDDKLVAHKQVEDLVVGDKAYGGGNVIGIVQETVDNWCIHDGIRISAAQLMWNTKEQRWTRAGSILPSFKDPGVGYHVILNGSGSLWCVSPVDGNLRYFRHYAEVLDPEMETMYQEDLLMRKAFKNTS